MYKVIHLDKYFIVEDKGKLDTEIEILNPIASFKDHSDLTDFLFGMNILYKNIVREEKK